MDATTQEWPSLRPYPRADTITVQMEENLNYSYLRPKS